MTQASCLKTEGQSGAGVEERKSEEKREREAREREKGEEDVIRSGGLRYHHHPRGVRVANAPGAVAPSPPPLYLFTKTTYIKRSESDLKVVHIQAVLVRFSLLTWSMGPILISLAPQEPCRVN